MLTSGTTEAPAEGLHGGGPAAAHVADHQVLPEALHDHAPGQDGRLHGDARGRVQKSSSGFQA